MYTYLFTRAEPTCDFHSIVDHLLYKLSYKSSQVVFI